MDTETKPFKKCMMGGTFDRLHEAHVSLLSTAAQLADEVFVGIVGEQLGEELFAKKEHGDMIEPFELRRQAVEEVLERYLDPSCFEVGELFDPWGPAPTEEGADLIVVSPETVDNGHRINEMREQSELKPLDIVVIPWVYVDGEKISSTRKRREEHE